MKFEVLGKDKLKLAPQVMEYAQKKGSKLLSLFDEDEVSSLTVLCSLKNNCKKVEITLATIKLSFRAEVKATDFNEGIDLGINKLVRQIVKYKEKISTYLHKESLAKIEANKQSFDLRGLEKEILATQLVKNKQIELKPMNKEEAMLAMELIDHDFYIYYDLEIDKTCVLYRREDGNIALIETKIG